MRRLLPSLLLFASGALAQPYDVLIRNGRLVDGTGNPWRSADVAVRDGRIVAIGSLGGQEAKTVIDAKGLVVAPGFIDIHNHSDDTLVADGGAESMVRQGVTSLILGEGGSAAPLGGKQEKRPASTDWTDFTGYFARLLRQGISPNVGSYVGSSQVWTYVHGEQAGPPSAAELSQMQDLVREAMRQGALGVSSSLSGPPGSWIDTATLVAMCKVAAEHGGIYSTHMRTEGQGVFEAVAEALEIGRQARIPVDVIHLKIADRALWGRMPELIATLRQARAGGQQVEAHVYPYRAGQNNLSSIVPPWAHEGGTQAMLARLKDPALRAKLRDQITNGIPGTNWYNHYTATGSWEGMLLVTLSHPEHKRFEGKRMNEVISALGGDPLDVLFRLLDANGGSVPTIYFHHSEEDMRFALQQPFVSVGSDGTAVKTEGPLAKGHPHPRYYGTFPRVLGRYVREEKVLSLEEAVRKMTSANAAKIGIHDRGILRPGLWADITIFDPERVIDRSTWEQPHQYAEGIEYVLVNGKPVLERGKPTAARPGQILYGAGRAEPEERRVADDRAAAEWVIRSGGTVRLVGGQQPIRSLADLPAAAFRVAAVDLVGTIILPADLKQLSGLSELTELFLPGPIFTPGAGSRLDANDELKALAGLRNLQKLHLSQTFLTNMNVQDKGLAHLRELTQLRELRLAQSRVKGASLAPFMRLQRLDLNYSTFADDGMPHLAGMRELTHLSLRDTLVSDAGLRHLANLSNMVSLDLYGARVTDIGLRHLAGMTRLQKLNVLGAPITDDGLDALARMTDLRELNLYRAAITNAGLAKLRHLTKLAALDLRYTRVTRGGVDEFRRSVPDCRVEFQESTPRGAGVELTRSKPGGEGEAAVAEWVRSLGGKAVIRDGRVREVDLSRTPLTDSQVGHLRPLAALDTLRLSSTEVGDLAAEALAGLGGLRHLDLGHTMISDRGVRSLGKLENLETLLLQQSLVRGEALAGLATLPRLARLSLAGCEVGDAGLRQVAQLVRLRELDLGYTEVTDEGLAALKSLPALESLDLTATDIGDAGLRSLASLPALTRLSLSYTRLTDAGVASLGPLTRLVRLEMARTRATDAAVPALAAMAGLKSVDLNYTSVTDKGVAALAAALPYLEELLLDSATVTDAGVPALASLRKLTHLNLYHTLMTDAGFATLREALPACRIVYDRESALPNRRRS